MIGYIYKITNLINQKAYIGKTMFNIEKRWKEHQTESKMQRSQNRPLYRAMNKYGVENFSIEVLEEVDINKLSIKEIYWIGYYDTYNNGYNATLGGDGKILYDYDDFAVLYEQGYTIKQIGELYNCDTEHIGYILKQMGYDTKTNAKQVWSKQVAAYDKNDNFIQAFVSMDSAARWVIEQGCTQASVDSVRCNIGRVASGKRKTAYNYKWKIYRPMV